MSKFRHAVISHFTTGGINNETLFAITIFGEIYSFRVNSDDEWKLLTNKEGKAVYEEQ